MKQRIFWWGFTGGISAAYAFVFLVIFQIALKTGISSTIQNVSLFLMLLASVFTLVVIFGRVKR